MSQRGGEEGSAQNPPPPQPAGEAAPPPHSLLHDQREAVLALEGVVELDQVHVAQLVHDVDLVLHILLTEPEGTGV